MKVRFFLKRNQMFWCVWIASWIFLPYLTQKITHHTRKRRIKNPKGNTRERRRNCIWNPLLTAKAAITTMLAKKMKTKQGETKLSRVDRKVNNFRADTIFFFSFLFSNLQISRKAFQGRLRGLAPDTFDQVLTDAQAAFLDRNWMSVRWDKILAASSQDDKIAKLMEYHEKDGWTQLLEVLDKVCRHYTGQGLAKCSWVACLHWNHGYVKRAMLNLIYVALHGSLSMWKEITLSWWWSSWTSKIKI